MLKFPQTRNDIDTSLFDPEEDMDLLVMIEDARTEDEIQRVVRMSRARMRARRRAQLRAERRPRLGRTARGAAA